MWLSRSFNIFLCTASKFNTFRLRFDNVGTTIQGGLYGDLHAAFNPPLLIPLNLKGDAHHSEKFISVEQEIIPFILWRKLAFDAYTYGLVTSVVTHGS